MITKWKFISRKTLLDHPRLKIVEDSVEIQDGKQIDYVREAPHATHSVAVITINDRGELLLQKEYSYPPDEILYQLPGGAIETNEDVLAAANRELSEESGYVGKDCEIIGSFYVNNRRSDRKQFVVLCKDLAAQKLPEDSEEFIENIWLPTEHVRQLVKDGVITNVGLLAALHLLDAKQCD